MLHFGNQKFSFIIAILLGALLTLCFAPFNYFWLLWLIMPGLFKLIHQKQSSKKCFWLAYSFGFSHFVTSLYWIANALLVDAHKFAWLVPFCIILVPAILAFYPALWGLVASKVSNRSPVIKVVVMAWLWVMMEVLRANLFSGFPWNLLAYTWSNQLVVMQLLAYIGPFGLSFVTILLALLPVIIWRQGKLNKACLLVTTICLIGLYSVGYWRLHHITPADSNYSVLIVQANLTQQAASERAKFAKLRAYIQMTSYETQLTQPDLIIWPEAAIDFWLSDSSPLWPLITEHLPDQAVLLTGGTYAKWAEGKLQPTNSLFAISKEQQVIDRYDKMHLVPFGEYIPLRYLLPDNIPNITEGIMDFAAGDRAHNLAIAKLAIKPLICYEAIFSKYSHSKVRPDMLVNVTNDAWFGDSIGPQQHFAMVKFRAVEQGLPLLRAANTGISAIISPLGQVLYQLPLNTLGTIAATVPQPLPQATIYHHYGNWPWLIVAMLLSLWLFWQRPAEY
jgi:apolipoprotein N-acyltransferase